MSEPLNLWNINPGEKAIITKISNSGAIKNRLMDIGLIPGTRIECVGKSPFGDPKAFLIRGAIIALRKEDCIKIKIKSKKEAKK